MNSLLIAQCLKAFLQAGKVSGLALVILLPAGCKTYDAKQQNFHHYWAAGQLDPAYADIARQSSKASSGDKLIYQLESGTVLQCMGKFPESVQCFRQAEEGIKNDLDKGSVRIGQELSGATVNQAMRAYEPCACDRIMLKTYLALSLLAGGDLEAASIELRGAYDYQQLAAEENAKQIEKATEEAKQQKVDVKRVCNDPKVKGPMQSIYNSCEGAGAYADYVNPFTTFLFTLDLLYHKKDPGNAENFLGRLQQMVPEHPAFAAEKEQLASLRNGKEMAPVTYVVVETGQAPRRGQMRVDIPIFIVTDKVPYIGAAFPTLEFEPDFASDFSVEAGGGSTPAVLLADFDRIMRTEFKNRLPAIVTRTIVSTTIKASANAALQKEGGWLGGLTGMLYQGAVNVADTRTWTTLPKQVHVARLATPGDGKLKIRSNALHLEKEVELKPGKLHIVWVRSISRQAPPIIAQINFP